jgi:oxygen-independent coproporphyrinogen-3 oxidase
MVDGLPCAGIYVHIPFCQAKCAYCDFISYPHCEHVFGPYVDALVSELYQRARDWSGCCFDTLFIGGGTPTLLSPADIGRVVDACRDALGLSADAEVTVEGNPGTVDLAELRALRRAGVNRLSLGVQSLHDDELALLGRIHTAAEAVQAYEWARSAGFENINLDLIFGVPNQPLAAWQATLERTLALCPEHLSLYSLIVEEGTPLAERITCGRLPAPEDDLAADMYELAEALLDEAGYGQYEISNWARRDGQATAGLTLPAYACRHNIKYWRNEPYLGVGVAAHSYDGQSRYANTADVGMYIARIQAGQSAMESSEQPTNEQQMGETMMLGLRMNQGVTWEGFRRRFNVDMRAVYREEIDEFVELGLLAADEQGVRLTPRGRLLGNQVFAAFLR